MEDYGNVEKGESRDINKHLYGMVWWYGTKPTTAPLLLFSCWCARSCFLPRSNAVDDDVEYLIYVNIESGFTSQKTRLFPEAPAACPEPKRAQILWYGTTRALGAVQ